MIECMVISPFKSSKANIDMYQHYYYCFLLAYFVMLLQFQKYLSDEEYIYNISDNIGESLNIIEKWGKK